VHKSNPINQLNFEQLDAIYCTGHKRGYKEDITKWGQLGLTGEWAERPIHFYGVQWPDGISNYIRLLVCNDGELKSNIMGVKIDHSPGVLTALFRILGEVDKDPLALGYGGLYGEKSNTKRIAISASPKGPYLLGSFDEVAAAKYPLTRYIHIVVNRPPGKPLDPKVKEFLKYILSSQGQQAVEREGVFMPLPARFVKQELEKLK
jgi:phosphate transport system substrate-binding protein